MKNKNSLTVETLTHDEATRKNIPTAEYQSVMRQDEQSPVRDVYRMETDFEKKVGAEFDRLIEGIVKREG